MILNFFEKNVNKNESQLHKNRLVLIIILNSVF